MTKVCLLAEQQQSPMKASDEQQTVHSEPGYATAGQQMQWTNRRRKRGGDQGIAFLSASSIDLVKKIWILHHTTSKYFNARIIRLLISIYSSSLSSPCKL